MTRRFRWMVAGLLIAGVLAGCGTSAGVDNSASGAESDKKWSYTDGSGETVTLPRKPTRIVAHANAAAALITMGIRPIGIYADMPVEDDPELRKLDLEGIEIVGETWGEIDIEKVLELRPDLIVAEWWPLEKAYSGLEEDASDESKKLPEIAPIVGVKQGKSLHTMMQHYEKLAAELGADVDTGAVAESKATFERARRNFEATTAANPDLTVMAVSPTEEGLYVAAPEGAAELADFTRWGLDMVQPDADFKDGYFELLSWENADKYQPDLIIVDNRTGSTAMRTAKSQPTWTNLDAAKAGAVTDWPAYWIRTYDSYAAELDKLTAAIETADQSAG